jgi:hypothetical protein
MARDTISVRFGGELTLDGLAIAIERFQELVAALTNEVSGDTKIEWVVEDLATGSAVATVRGRALTPEAVERVAAAYSNVGQALQAHSPIGYSARVNEAARGLMRLLDGRITSIAFRVDEDEALITSFGDRTEDLPFEGYGAIEGRVETVSRRGRLYFTLYDTLFDEAVRCYLAPGMEDTMRDIWGHRAIVEGVVKRDPLTGRPREVRSIARVTKLEEIPAGSYREARGAARRPSNDPLPEEIIRRLRDA